MEEKLEEVRNKFKLEETEQNLAEALLLFARDDTSRPIFVFPNHV